MKGLVCALLVCIAPSLCYAETKTYEMSYKSWANDNYPASRCFAPSFKVDEMCGSDYRIVENCLGADTSIQDHVKAHCAENTDKVTVTYNIENGSVIGISGYFGSFNTKYSKSKYLHDIKPLLPMHDHLVNEDVAAYRVGGALDNRIYIIVGDVGVGEGFRLLEYVKDCQSYIKSEGASSCSIAEYGVVP